MTIQIQIPDKTVTIKFIVRNFLLVRQSLETLLGARIGPVNLTGIQAPREDILLWGMYLGISPES